jgi:hypothetical protein
MSEYLLLVHGNTKSPETAADWHQFLAAAHASGFFRGGSEVGEKLPLGELTALASSAHIVGYMRFDADDRTQLLELLRRHPTVLHGGTVELCTLPKS